MTERSTRPEAMARTAKREDTTPKAKKRGGIRGVDSRATISEARSRGIDTGTNAGAAMVSPNKPLTEKQKLFVKHWAEGESILTAAVRAGYADGGQMAYRMVHMPNIQALKAKYEAKYEEAAQMTRKKVMDMHLEAFEMAKLMSEPATMVSAAREVGKMCGYYAPVEVKMKVDVTGNIMVDRLNSMSDAELLKVITSGQALELPHVEELGSTGDSGEESE